MISFDNVDALRIIGIKYHSCGNILGGLFIAVLLTLLGCDSVIFVY